MVTGCGWSCVICDREGLEEMDDGMARDPGTRSATPALWIGYGAHRPLALGPAVSCCF